MKAGVKTVTVTVNAVDADILSNICSHIVSGDGVYYTGKEAALRLLASQLAGIRKVSGLGVVVKINTVLIPGVNDGNIGEIARVTAGVGASLMNIIPLIPQNEMSHLRPPDCLELNRAREAAEEYLPVFRHCRQCRADACGIPGRNADLADGLYEQRVEETFSHG